EFYHLPSPRIKELYRHYVNIGADAIISHHTHAYSGYEVYKGKPVFYGLGNFIYDWPGKVNTPWNQGYVVRLKISKKIDFNIIPLKQCDEEPGVIHLSETEEKTFMKRIAELNAIIANDKLLEIEFRKYCEQVKPMYDAYIEPYFGKTITSLRKRGLFPKFMGRRKRLLLLNITRCESHREVLHRLLKKYE
ncbi:MAG: CapA family protein, partial [Bacteroidales bacterium]|nr:CapA family protein [Bacteroidales bacterium]